MLLKLLILLSVLQALKIVRLNETYNRRTDVFMRCICCGTSCLFLNCSCRSISGANIFSISSQFSGVGRISNTPCIVVSFLHQSVDFGKEPRYPLSRRLAESQSQSDVLVKRKVSIYTLKHTVIKSSLIITSTVYSLQISFRYYSQHTYVSLYNSSQLIPRKCYNVNMKVKSKRFT